MNDAAEKFAENLARQRREAGLTISALAERAEIHRTHVGLLLKGQRIARLDTVVKLAGALGVKPGALLEGITWEPPVKSNGQYRRADTAGGDSGSSPSPPPL
jgi:transcriptional regulator with XRE-family HTH domain